MALYTPPPKPLKPFVTDTLFKLLGGSFPIEQQNRWVAPYKGGERVSGQTVMPDTVKLYGDQPDNVLAHEAGHVLDSRSGAPMVFAKTMTHMKDYPNEDYFSKDPTEYTAEALSRALMSMRNQFKDSTEVDKKMPGAIEFIRWLQQQKLK